MSPNDTIELTTEAKALLQADNVPEAVPPGSSERVLGRLSHTLSLVALAEPLSHAARPAPSLAPVAAAGAKLKLLIAGLALGGVVSAVLVAGKSSPAPRVGPGAASAGRLAAEPSARAARPLTSGEAAGSQAAPNAPDGNALRGDEPQAPSSPEVEGQSHARRDHAELTPSASVLAEERGLLDSARAALAAGQASVALQQLTAHERRFPRGRLVEERESLAVQALAHTGGSDAARRRFAAFQRRFPRSIFLPALKAVVDSLP